MIHSVGRVLAKWQDSTRSYYENYASDYFQATRLTDLTREWDRFTSLLSRNDAILDLGSGSGRDLRYFANRGYRAFGIDYSYPLARLAHEYSRQEIIVGDFRHIPLKEASFHAVWSIGSLLHLRPDEVPTVLLHLHSILKQEGILFTSMKKGEGYTIDAVGRYTMFYQREHWVDLLVNNGFDVISIEEVTEQRQTKQGKIVDVTWIECLAKTSLQFFPLVDRESFSVV